MLGFAASCVGLSSLEGSGEIVSALSVRLSGGYCLGEVLCPKP